MDESEFNKLADQALMGIADMIDDLLGDKIDVEIQSGILTLDLDRGGQYVINKHGPNREIWLSSPVSGAAHFKSVDGAWISTRDPSVNLLERLGAELNISLTL